MLSDAPQDELGEIELSPGGEHWIEFGPPGARHRVGFHDYAGLYAVPGLYERVFHDVLEMRSAAEVTAAAGDAWSARGVDPGALRALDFGAGNGVGGEYLRRLGAGSVVGLDLEPEARVAAERDRPGVYDDYVVGDLDDLPAADLERLRALRFNVLLAVAALGMGHVAAPVLERAIDLVEPGGWVALAIAERLTPEGADDEARAEGFPGLLEGLFDSGRAELVLQRTYNHRRNSDGSDHPAVAVVARLRE